MVSFFEFLLHCLRAPIDEVKCGPFWLVVSFAAFGAGATIAVLLVHSYVEWWRWRAWRLARERRASKDDSDPLNDPDFAEGVRDVVRLRALTDRRKSPRMSADRRSAPRGFDPDLHPE